MNAIMGAVGSDINNLNLTGTSLKKLPRPTPEVAKKITKLHLDNNELSRLENINQFVNVVELSAKHNHIPRIYAISALLHLVRLDLSHNEIYAIEGLKELVHLRYLNLAHNKIKAMDSFITLVQLETLDLSENQITVIPNISHLVRLKNLYLHKNKISTLRHCLVYLPTSLEVLTLASNDIRDLNEISNLKNLHNLRELSIVSNPCVEMTGQSIGFDYRPFIINWCTEIKVIDGFVVGELESLKGEWLYSQGRGRHFKVGQHAELVQYLSETCVLNNENMQIETERKLRLILSKAQHHQSQLRMEHSDHSDVPDMNELMSRSLDPSLLIATGQQRDDSASRSSLTRSLHCEPVTAREVEKAPSYVAPTPLPAASKLVPVPESLISPMVTNTPPLVVQNVTNDTVSPAKLQTIKNKAQAKRVKPTKDKEQAAVFIQKMWRGYHTRNLNAKVLSVYQHMQTKRTYKYIQKLSEDMEATRAALDNEHKLQLLQMQAINALWRKVVSLQPAKLDESMGEVKGLALTCDRLNNQVQQLQSSMQEVLRCVSPNSGSTSVKSGNASVIATQTDIIAVHTPCGEGNENKFLRPSTLPLLSQNRIETDLINEKPAESKEENGYENSPKPELVPAPKTTNTQ